MLILRRPYLRLPVKALLSMKILIDPVLSSAHLFGGRPLCRADPLESHSDLIFAHLRYSSNGVEISPASANPSSDFFSVVRERFSEIFDLLEAINPRVQNFRIVMSDLVTYLFINICVLDGFILRSYLGHPIAIRFALSSASFTEFANSKR
uniref:Uncharacterized protein n=1 Tax=Caenorhabditis japonica TaxID=281687 RepID=A0A8R1I9T5_CAEJA